MRAKDTGLNFIVTDLIWNYKNRIYKLPTALMLL